MSAWPSISCSERRSQPPASRCVANVWRSVCGLILPVEPRAARVALDDLVEALAGEPAAAVVEEQRGLHAVAHEPRPAPAEIGDERARGGRADRHQALLGALAAGPQHAGLEVHVADLETDRLRRAEPAGVHQLQQRAVAQRGRLGPPRRLQQPGHLVPGENLREAPALLGGTQVDGRVVGDQVLAAQVAVEGPQAGDLALQRRRRDRGAVLPAGRHVGDEVGEVAVRRGQRVGVRALEVRAELKQVGPVGLERVAGEPALELQVGQEVEQQVLERLGRRRDRHGGSEFAAAKEPPARCNSPVSHGSRSTATSPTA